MSVEDKVKKMIAELLDIKESQVSLEASFINDLEADSLDLADLIMSISEVFDIDISDEEAEQITTVGEVVDCIKAKQA